MLYPTPIAKLIDSFSKFPLFNDSADTDIGIKIFIIIYPNSIIFDSFPFIYLLLHTPKYI